MSHTTAELFIDSRCALGEGPFWHPLLGRLFWFDILNRTLFSATAEGQMVDRFTFDTPASAAGVIDADNLAIAAVPGLFRLHLPSDTREPLLPIEPDSRSTRTNDGRVHPAGGLWVGTMALEDADSNPAGTLYQLRGGETTVLRRDLCIPNATCFAPDGRRAYFADTATGVILTVATDPETGLPQGEWTEFAGAHHPGVPDGAVVDAEGFVWNARWGGASVIRFAPDGRVDRVIELPTSRVTCPAFGGPGLTTLYITTARDGLTPEELEAEPLAGGIFAVEAGVAGQPETLFKA
jgi:sugar lactone lactonase YvrE